MINRSKIIIIVALIVYLIVNASIITGKVRDVVTTEEIKEAVRDINKSNYQEYNLTNDTIYFLDGVKEDLAIKNIAGFIKSDNENFVCFTVLKDIDHANIFEIMFDRYRDNELVYKYKNVYFYTNNKNLLDKYVEVLNKLN